MTEIEYTTEEDIRNEVNDTCEFEIEDWGIGAYEYGDGNYIDKNPHFTLTDQEIMVQYPLDTESIIFTRILGTYCLTDGHGMDFECDWIAELNHIEWNPTKGGFYEAHYGVFAG